MGSRRRVQRMIRPHGPCSILNKIGSVPYGELIKGWLKAGYIAQENKYLTETGTPQGGVISPLLANIGWHGARNTLKRTKPKARHHQVRG